MFIVIWKLTWDCLLKHIPTASLCSLGFLEHVRWLSRGSMLRMDVPESQKWKLLAQLKAFPITCGTLLLPYSIDQGSQRANWDLKRWSNLYPLMGQGGNGKRSVWCGNYYYHHFGKGRLLQPMIGSHRYFCSYLSLYALTSFFSLWAWLFAVPQLTQPTVNFISTVS